MARSLEVRTQIRAKGAHALFPSLSHLQYQHAVLVRRDVVRRALATGGELPRAF